MTTMLGITHQEGQPTITEVARPMRTQKTDVLLRVLLAGLCRTDVHAGFGRIPTKRSRILGHEFVGEVLETSSSSSLSIGQRVAINPNIPCLQCDCCHQGRYAHCSNRSFLGLKRDGCFAEYIVIPEVACLPLPPSLSLQRGAYVEPVAAALAMFNTDISADKEGLLLGTGRIVDLCFAVLRHHGFQSITKAKEPPKNQKFDFIVECNLQRITIADICKSLRDGGLLVLKSRHSIASVIDVQSIVRRSLRIQGVHYGSFEQAIQLLQDSTFSVEQYFGETYTLSTFVTLFASSEEKKIFCDPVCVES